MKTTSASKRGRPTAMQAGAIDARVLSVARALFLADGYAATTMDDVAKAAGVAKGTLYVRYPGKYALFRAVVLERLETWGTAGDDQASDADTLADLLLERARRILGPMRNAEVRAFMRVVAAEAINHPELKDSIVEAGIHGTIATVATDLRDAAARDGGGATDPVGMATIFVSSLMGWYRGQSLVGDIAEVDCDRFARRLVAVTLAARQSW